MRARMRMPMPMPVPLHTPVPMRTRLPMPMDKRVAASLPMPMPMPIRPRNSTRLDTSLSQVTLLRRLLLMCVLCVENAGTGDVRRYRRIRASSSVFNKAVSPSSACHVMAWSVARRRSRWALAEPPLHRVCAQASQKYPRRPP